MVDEITFTLHFTVSSNFSAKNLPVIKKAEGEFSV